jgi:hypothetical protein
MAIHGSIVAAPGVVRGHVLLCVFPDATQICARHKTLILLRGKCLVIQGVLLQRQTLLVHKADKRGANDERDSEEHQVYRHGVIVKDLVRQCVEGRLRKVEETSEADDEAVYLAKRGKAKDLGRVVAIAVSGSLQVGK